VRKPRILDLCCCAGGNARGYQLAGFHVTGIDIKNQPRYIGDEFHQDDAIEFLKKHHHEFNAVHGSPPCQRFSDLAKRNGNASAWPDLLTPMREAMRATGLPYIIENVEGAPLIDPIWLCGTTFSELSVIRHRGFESNIVIPNRPCVRPHPLVFTYDKRKSQYGKVDQNTSFVSVNGGGNCTVANASRAMGIDWMTKDELNEAIPPAYAEYIGRFLIQQL
jgi:DNA (cytosine-5)-methyltransferase 1